MQELQINKTWNDRMTGGIINHFFENMEDKNFDDDYSDNYHEFNADGSIYFYVDRQDKLNRYHNTGMQMFLVSKEALDEVDNLNQAIFDTEDAYGIPADSVYYAQGARYDTALIESIWVNKDSNIDFGTFIRANIPGKEGAYWKTIKNLDWDNFTVTPDMAGNKINVKYNVPFQLGEHFNHATYLTDGNTDLFLVIPYIRKDGYRAINVKNPVTGKYPTLSSYIALKVTDISGDGDIKFDHIDDIDYVDKLEFTLTTPHLI